MSADRKYQRREERKFKRIFVRYGHKGPEHKAVAQQISASGFFLSTNEIVYANDSPIAVEIKGPSETWLVLGIVRHAIKVHPSLARFNRPGMGVELTDIPDPCRNYLNSL
ncbi:MAG: PilZ domain-containing protein [Candidatus Methylomirabilia bacterium]